MSESVARLGETENKVGVTTFVFFLFQVYQLDFFLHLSTRIPGIGILRPSMLIFLVLAISMVSQKDKFKFRLDHPTFKAFNAFLLMLLLTLPFVHFPGSVVKNNIPIFLKAVVFMYFTALILDTDKRFKWAMFIFVFCQVFRVLEPLFLHITQGYWGSGTYMGEGEFEDRLAGAPYDVINPNELGFVIVTAVPFLHYFLLGGKWYQKGLYFVLLALLLFALILTMSRGAFLALLVVGWNVFKESKYKPLFIIAAIIIAIAGVSVMTSEQKDRYLSLFSSESKHSKSVDGRFRGMEREFELGSMRPIFGFGLGTTPEAKFQYTGHRQASHNMYAEVFIEVGLVGMFFFFRIIRSIYRQQKSSNAKQEELDPFYQTVFKVLRVVFWMFVVYSFNYWGLTQYYWYNLAGLTIAAAYLSHSAMKTARHY